MHLPKGLCLGLLASIVPYEPHVARADVIASESFVYPQGVTVNGQSGGIGFAGGWITGQSTAFVADPAITGAPAIGAVGGALRVLGSGRVFRRIDTSPGSPAVVAGLVQSHTALYFNQIDGIGAPGTTVWVGMLVAGGSANAGDETQYHLYDGARTDVASLGLGDQNKDGEVVAMLRGGNVAQWGFERTCNHSACNGAAAAGYFGASPQWDFGGTHWTVTRFVFKATTTEITMWRDPAPGVTAPADASAISLTPFGGGTAAQTTIVPAMFFDTIAPNASGNYGYVVDEIRITTTFAELSMGGGSGTGQDGGVGVDAGTLSDAGMVSDAGPSSDAGTQRDAGAATDAGSPLDASVGADAGTHASSTGSGCGCAVAGDRGRSPGSAAALLAFVVTAARRRARRRGMRGEPRRATQRTQRTGAAVDVAIAASGPS